MFKNFNTRIFIIRALISVFGIMCFIAIIRLSFFKKDKYAGSKELYKYYTSEAFDTLSAEERKNCVILSPVTPSRGVIYDDTDKPLVSNVRVYSISIDGQSFNKGYLYFKKDEPYLDTLIHDLAIQFQAIFGSRYPQYNVKKYQEKLTRALKEQKTVQIFGKEQVVKEGKWILEKDVEQLKKLPLFCRTIQEKDRARYGLPKERKIKFPRIVDVGREKLTVRVRPYGSMAQRILGNPEQGNGIDGCKAFNKILSGEAGTTKTLIINNISIPLETENPPIEGGNIYTTLNTNIQKIVHQELLNKSEVVKPMWSCAIVMETATGDIKAISNFSRVIQDDDTMYVESRNNAMVSESAEPGSTFKIASLLAYLERTNCDTTKKYPINIHSFKTRGRRDVTRYDSRQAAAKGEQLASAKEIIQRSSNVGIASMIRSAFPNYNDYVRKLNEMGITLGFRAQIGKLPPINLKYDCKSFEDQYGCYFGAGFFMQPMQTLVYFNAIANNGKMMQPRFVRASQVGDVVTEYPCEVIKEQIASPRTIKMAQAILKSVVMERPGTAYRYHDEHFPFAGKTGTRDIYDRTKGKYDENRNSISFCGYFPADNPQYTCIVYMFDVKEHSGFAAGIFANIAKQIMFLPKTIDKTQKYLTVAKPVRYSDLNVIGKNLGITITPANNSQYGISKIINNQIVLSPYQLAETDKIPNVVGLTADDAMIELRKRGIKVSLTGIGIVTNQLYNPQTRTMKLTLEPG